MKQGSLARAILGIAGSVACAAHAAPRNEVPILIYWNSGPANTQPSGVAFADPGAGSIPFVRGTDHFKGIRPAQGSWAFHDISLLYSGQETPLALRTRSGVERVRIDVALPAAASCKQAQVNSLKHVSEGAPVTVRVNAMLAARHLLELRINVCPAWAKRDLAEIYFAMNCSLAKNTSFFRVSEEAKDRYRRFARDTAVAEARIRACDTQMFGVAAASLRRAAHESLEQGNFEHFAAVNTELRASAADPAWKAGLEVQGINASILEADWLKGLYTKQQQASSSGEYAQALEANATLGNLLEIPQFSDAFEKVSLDEQRLDADRAYLEAKAAAAPGPQE